MRVVFALIACAVWSDAVHALDHVAFRQDAGQRTVDGRVLVEAEDGGLLVQGRDGRLWTVQPDELISRDSDDAEFAPLSRDEVAEQLLSELPDGFQIYETQNYLICFNTSRAYAQWCGSLFEKLHRAFTNYWKRQGFDLQPAEFPLVALVFADRESYAEYAQPELGASAANIIGYYSLATNRMTLYDLTGVEDALGASVRRVTAAEIARALSGPEAARTIATVIHEATHQLAFNSGLHTRYADIPLWVSEGIAVYFETPNPNSPRGWRNIGAVHPVRLAAFRDYLRRRPVDSLASLVADDKRFRDGKQATEAYAEAWALNYYLLRQKKDQYVAYLQKLSEKKRLLWDDPDARLREFADAFGDLRALDEDFLRYMSRVN